MKKIKPVSNKDLSLKTQLSNIPGVSLNKEFVELNREQVFKGSSKEQIALLIETSPDFKKIIETLFDYVNNKDNFEYRTNQVETRDKLQKALEFFVAHLTPKANLVFLQQLKKIFIYYPKNTEPRRLVETVFNHSLIKTHNFYYSKFVELGKQVFSDISLKNKRENIVKMQSVLKIMVEKLLVFLFLWV